MFYWRRMRCRVSWMLQLFVIASHILLGIHMQGIPPKDDTTPYRRVSTQCNPQEGSCTKVDPKAGILGYDSLAVQTIDQLDLNGTEAGAVDSSNSSIQNSLGNLPPKEFLGQMKLISPSSEVMQNPAEEDDSSPPSQEPLINPMLPLLGQFSLQVSPLPSVVPSMAPATPSKDDQNQKNSSSSPSPSVLPLMSPKSSPTPPKSPSISPKTSPSPDQKISSPSPASPGFNPTTQQSKGLIRQNSSEIQGEQQCSITERGCSCEEDWQFNGGNYQGCFNPDNDAIGEWCIVKLETCQETPGQIQTEGANKTTVNYFDYCVKDCQLTDSNKNDTAVSAQQNVEEEEEIEVPQQAVAVVPKQEPEQEQEQEQDPSECLEVVSECKDSQFSVAFADGSFVPSVTYIDYSYFFVQGWWNLAQPAQRIRWCSPSKLVALFVQAFGIDQDRTSDVIWSDQFVTNRQYCVPDDGQEFSLAQFVSNSNPGDTFFNAFYNGAYRNFSSCEQYEGTLKRFFVYQTPQVLTINKCQ